MLVLRSSEDVKHQNNMRKWAQKNISLSREYALFFSTWDTSHSRWMCSAFDVTIVTQQSETRLFTWMYLLTHALTSMLD